MNKKPSITNKRKESRKESRSDAKDVLDRVNDPNASAHALRVRKILEFYILLETSRVELYRSMRQRRHRLLSSAAIFIEAVDPKAFAGDELESLAALVHESSTQLNTRLGRYRWPPMVRTYYTRLSPSYDSVGRDDNEDWENWAVYWLLTLTSDGSAPISRFRLCKWCQRLFYPRTSHAKYCSPAHRSGAYNQTPGGRANHAKSQRKYMDGLRKMVEAEAKQFGIGGSGLTSKRRRVSKSK
jgi:hypothetical protein